MPRPVVKLSDFDPEPLIEYAITDADLRNVYFYLRAMQAHLTSGTWDEICIASYYGTSALLHEVVELRILLNRDPYLLTYSFAEVKSFARHPDNYDAHIRGLEIEYRYLQRIVQRIFGVRLDIGALLKANSQRGRDWDDLFETDLPFFAPSAAEVLVAKTWLARLRASRRSKT